MKKCMNSAQFFACGTIVLWASAFAFTKIALNFYAPETIGVLRYLVASLFFILVGSIKKIGFPDLIDVPRFLLSGLLGFTIYMIAFNKASLSLTSATGSIIIATAPVFTAIVAFILFHETIRFFGWIAIMIEFGGILVLALGHGSLSVNSGVLWMFIAAICISGYNLLQRDFVKKYTAMQSTAYSIFAGTVCLLIYLPKAVTQMFHVPMYHIFIICFLGLFPSAIAYMLWAKALMMADKTSDVTNFMFVNLF